MKILLTAFDPFGGETINPAREVAAALSDQIGGADIIKLWLQMCIRDRFRPVRVCGGTICLCIGSLYHCGTGDGHPGLP